MSNSDFIRTMMSRHPYLRSNSSSVIPAGGVGASLRPQRNMNAPALDYDSRRNQAILGNPQPLYEMVGLI